MSGKVEAYISEMARLPDNYFWHQTRYRLVREALGSGVHRMLDFGAGDGRLLRWAMRDNLARELVGFDVAVAGNPTLPGVTWTDRRETLALAPFDAITALDVIEHIDEDVAAAKDLRGYLAPGGRLILTVPALQALWSDWDVRYGHRRRYTRRQVVELLLRAGFSRVVARYFFSYLVPLAILRRARLVGGGGYCADSAVSPMTNGVLTGLGDVERVISRVVAPPIGTSVFAVAYAPGR